jgi:phosphatidylserine/phosphatidylglycerophosphate/cardiolipin synthase-like enzyme
MDDAWLDSANAGDLDALATRLRTGLLAPPYSAVAAKLANAGGAQAFLASLGSTSPHIVAWMLERLAAERRKSSDRHASVAQLAWTGAAQGEQSIRDTRAVLDGLFRQASRSVLISTFVIYEGRAVFSELIARLRERPTLQVEIYVHLEHEKGDVEAQRVSAYLKKFREAHWPADLPLPALYFAPETETGEGKRITLHAKTVVVDDRWAFVTSANFTQAAHARNIEAGVLLDHPELARILAGQFRGLRESGHLRRMG